MVILINGSFGVGKSTVAGLLRAELAGSRVYDPEVVGSVLMRLPTWIKLRGAGSNDFQDIDLWRKSVAAGVRLTRLLASGPVIVPMAFDRRDYLAEVTRAIQRFEPDLRMFCLRASLPVIRQRLMARGTPVSGPGSEWIRRRMAECTIAHQAPHFGLPIDTDSTPAPEVVAKILASLQGHTST
jgi:predicted kinase